MAYRAFLQAEPLAQILLNQLSKAAGDAELTRHVLLAVRCWIQLGWSDFRDDPRLMELLWRLLRVAGDDAAAELTAAVNQRIEADAVARQSAADLQASTPPNVSIVVVDAQQLAEQLALYNSRVREGVGVSTPGGNLTRWFIALPRGGT